jgi:hypothetical protein
MWAVARNASPPDVYLLELNDWFAPAAMVLRGRRKGVRNYHGVWLNSRRRSAGTYNRRRWHNDAAGGMHGCLLGHLLASRSARPQSWWYGQ